MSSPASPLRRPRSERFAAWLYTGPLGHFWSVLADIVVFWPRHVRPHLLRRRRRRR